MEAVCKKSLVCQNSKNKYLSAIPSKVCEILIGVIFVRKRYVG
jgi:hypothetical protein